MQAVNDLQLLQKVVETDERKHAMTHDSVEIVAVIQEPIEVLIEDDQSIVLFGPDEVEDGYEADPWADNGKHLRHINVDTMNFTADEARQIGHALIEAADHIDHDPLQCPNCACSDEQAGGRTPQQIASDVAAATLERLADLSDELGHLQAQLDELAGWAAFHQLERPGGILAGTAEVIGGLGCCVPEAVRDIAATLPIRGIDYGTTTDDSDR